MGCCVGVRSPSGSPPVASQARPSTLWEMVRLLWLALNRDDPEESFPPLAGIRPAPEPMSFVAASPESVSRRLPDVVLVGARGHPQGAAGGIQKLRQHTEGGFFSSLLAAGVVLVVFLCGG